MPTDDRPIRCGECEAPAIVRYAMCGRGEKPSIALARRAQHACSAHYLTPRTLAGIADLQPTWLLVVDLHFTRQWYPAAATS